MSIDDFTEPTSVPINHALQKLPLFDNPYLRMQALNLAFVFVSALSQMWIFGLYELLRTWRQRVCEILKFAEDLAKLTGSDLEKRIMKQQHKIKTAYSKTDGIDLMHWRPFDLAAKDSEFVNQLSNALDRSERVFRRIEALRISLAKHEVPKSKGAYAMAPGYGRIDMTNGSIYWQITHRGNEIDVISRQRIADERRELARDSILSILPKKIQAKLRDVQDYSYGIKRIAVTLDDGKEYKNVYVSWNKEIIAVDGFESIPFDVTKVVDVRTDIS